MHSCRLANDKAIGDQLADGLTGVRVTDFVDFIRVEPNLALSTANDRGCQTLLSAEINPR
jgi:hypothetical protein